MSGEHTFATQPTRVVPRGDHRPVDSGRHERDREATVDGDASSELRLPELVFSKDVEEMACDERQRKLARRFERRVPPEYILAEYGTPSLEDIREAGYNVVTLEKGRARFLPKKPVGVYIEHTMVDDHGGEIHTEAYHHFTPAEQAMLGSIDGLGYPVAFGRPDPESKHGRRIDVLPQDLTDGTMHTISRTHVEFGLSNAVRDSSAHGGTHFVLETPDVSIRKPIIAERARNQDMYPNGVVTDAELKRAPRAQPERMKQIVAFALSTDRLPTQPEAFVSQVMSTTPMSDKPMTRADIARAIDRLRWTQLQKPAELQDHGGYVDPVIRGQYVAAGQVYDRAQAFIRNSINALEQALNPMIEKSSLSRERQQQWRERAQKNGAGDVHHLAGHYALTAQHLDHMRDWSSSMLPIDHVTQDNGLQDAYKAWQKRWEHQALNTQARQELAQLNHAYRRWLDSAVTFLRSYSE